MMKDGDYMERMGCLFSILAVLCCVLVACSAPSGETAKTTAQGTVGSTAATTGAPQSTSAAIQQYTDAFSTLKSLADARQIDRDAQADKLTMVLSDRYFLVPQLPDGWVVQTVDWDLEDGDVEFEAKNGIYELEISYTLYKRQMFAQGNAVMRADGVQMKRRLLTADGTKDNPFAWVSGEYAWQQDGYLIEVECDRFPTTNTEDCDNLVKAIMLSKVPIS